ncbi:MAG: thiolase family protein [Thermoanaerobaculia bacterium]
MTGKADRPDLMLVAPVRTSIGRFGGELASLSAVDLGVAAGSACLERAGLANKMVDQVIFGHARQGGCGPNPARQIAYRCGVPVDRPALTINQACGSGLQAVFSAARAILLGEAQIVLAGGTESMSNTPYLLPRARWGQRLGHDELVDGMYRDGFIDPLSELIMGETAEELADEAKVDRLSADRWAARSQQRCEKARNEGYFQTEIVPVQVEKRGVTSLVETDEHPRDAVTIESLAKLTPVFRDEGTVTAGNASGITDGAAAVLVASASAVDRLGLQPVARLVDWEVVGVDPRIMGIGPVPAVRNLLQRRRMDFDEIDLVELNEAFATQVLACLAELPFDRDRVNVSGGAISLGHPIGCSGARVLVTLLHGMNRLGSRHGIATLCVSGGMGLAALVERQSS